MRLTDLRDARIRTLDGETLGRVHEVHVDDGRIVALTCGAGSLIERLTARKHGRRVPWDCVVKVRRGEVVITPDAPSRKGPKKASASRSRQGSRRPSGRPSKR